MWSMDNTDGFTAEQLDMINVVRSELTDDGMEGKAADDLITNAWVDSIKSAVDLRAKIRR